MNSYLFITLLAVVNGYDDRIKRRIPFHRQLKGGGGGGGGSSSVSLDPNNLVIPEDFVFFKDPQWPPA